MEEYGRQEEKKKKTTPIITTRYITLENYFNRWLSDYIFIFRKIKSDRALICECTDHNLQGYNDFQYFLTNFSALSHHHSTKIAY